MLIKKKIIYWRNRRYRIIFFMNFQFYSKKINIKIFNYTFSLIELYFVIFCSDIWPLGLSAGRPMWIYHTPHKDGRYLNFLVLLCEILIKFLSPGNLGYYENYFTPMSLDNSTHFSGLTDSVFSDMPSQNAVV